MRLVTCEDLTAIGAAIQGRSNLYARSTVCGHVNDPTFPPPYGKNGARWVWKLRDAERWYRNRTGRRCKAHRTPR